MEWQGNACSFNCSRWKHDLCKNGRIGIELKDVFLPMRASALYAGMKYLEPLVFESVYSKNIQDLQNAFIQRLKK